MDIAARWTQIEGSESRLRADVESRVAKRRTGRFDSLHPLMRYRLGGTVAPSDELGYDANGRLVLDRFNSAVSYTVYGDAWAETYRFEHFDVVLLSTVERWTFAADGRPSTLVAYDRRGPLPRTSERFEYDDRGRVTAIVAMDEEPSRLIASYDDDSERPALLRYAGAGEVLYRRPVKGMQQIVERIEDALLGALLDWAWDQRPGQPVAVFLVGWSVAFPLVPSPVLVTEAQLGIWNAAEFASDHIELADSEDAQHVTQAWQDDDGPSGRFYARVAKRLAAVDYSHWPLTEDFVVAVVDMQTCDERSLARQLRASVAPERLNAFKRAGLITLP